MPRLFGRAGERAKRRGKPRLYRVCLIARWSSEKRTSDTESSREAAQECSPQPALSLSKGRKPWVDSGTRASPNGAKEKLRPRLRRDDPALTHTLQRCDNCIVLNAASSRWGNAATGKHCFRNLFSRAMCCATCFLTKPTIAGRCVCSRIGSDSRLPNEVAYRLWNWEKPWKECGSPSGSMREIGIYHQSSRDDDSLTSSTLRTCGRTPPGPPPPPCAPTSPPE